MRRTSRIVLIGIVFLFCASVVGAADGVDAGSFVRDGVGSRAFGFGGAFVAIADDASATVWNPAGLAQLEGVNLQGMYTNRFGLDISFQFLGATMRLGALGIGVSVVRSSIDDIPFYGDEGEGFFSETQSLMLASVAYDLGSVLALDVGVPLTLAVGANGKVYTHRILDGRGLGFGVDLSALATFGFDWGTVSIGYTSLDTAVTQIRWTGTDHNPTNDVPWIHKIGASVDLLEGALKLAVDGDVALGRPHLNRLHLGGEYRLLEQLAARGGVVLTEDGPRVTYGGSVRLGGFVFDYAYVPHAALGASHVLTLGYEVPAWWEDETEQEMD
jgi:hypothetical protein